MSETRSEPRSGESRTEAVPAAVLTILTTEHFTLQGARSSTVGESTARAALFIGAVSSALIAMSFLGQASGFGDAFDAFSVVVLPTVYALGVFTFVRLVESSNEDILYGRAINRIRNLYRQASGDYARYLLMGGHDDVYGVLANMAMSRPSRWQLYFTLASMVAVVDSVVGGTTLALVTGKMLGAPILVAVAAGISLAAASLFGHFHVQQRMHVDARGEADVLFPSPG
jgi:predicted small integral membrane protein